MKQVVKRLVEKYGSDQADDENEKMMTLAERTDRDIFEDILQDTPQDEEEITITHPGK
jgi:hypothetical protein